MYVITEQAITTDGEFTTEVGTEVFPVLRYAHERLNLLAQTAAAARCDVIRSGGGRLAAQADDHVRTWTVTRFGN